MKNKSKKIIKTLLISATVALFHGSAKADTKKDHSLDLGLGIPNGGATPEISKGQLPIMKNVYKIMRSGDSKMIMAHRSHSSHRSHRSSRGGHYSHSSSSHYSHSSSSYGSGSRSSIYATPAKTAGDYSLGDRTLSTGIHGSDVDALIIKLSAAGYLHNYQGKKQGNYHVFDLSLLNALKHFQKDAGVKEDGKITKDLLNLLSVWDPLCTTISLGARTLSTEDKTAGFDVDELIELLTVAGYAPQQELLERSNPKTVSSDEILYITKLQGIKDYDTYQQNKFHYVFTKDVEKALKTFQAFHGIKPTGNLDESTIIKLKSYKK